MLTTFTRASSAWAFGPDSEFSEFAPDVLRREYSLSNSNLLGALVDGQATNSMPFSEDFSSWPRSYNGREHYSPLPVEGFPRDFTRFKPTYIEDPGNSSRRIGLFDFSGNVGGAGEIWTLSLFVKPINSISTGGRPLYVILSKEGLPGAVYLNLRDLSISGSYESAGIIDCGKGIYRLWATFISDRADSSSYTFIYFSNRENSSFDPYPTGDEEVAFFGVQVEKGSLSSYIYTDGAARSRAADKFDAPAGSWLPDGLHTWRGAVRMSRDPRQPTVLGHPDGRIYAQDGRLHLDGPGTLWQPDGIHEPGVRVPFYWTVQFPGAAPDFTLGRSVGDTDYWNGHLIDIAPNLSAIPEYKIRRELGL